VRTRYAIVAVAVVALTAAQSSIAGKNSSLVGRWQTVRTCQGLVDALNKTGLGPLAPVVVGDYFPNQAPAELAKKKNVCTGAKPQLHSHFFTADGTFGSLDQKGQRVDDGTYRITGPTVTISNSDVSGAFRFRIQGKTLMLRPLLTAALKQEALADRLDFHSAGWMVAVAYNGHPWKRVACRSWC
jgi:hypothetical protein